MTCHPQSVRKQSSICASKQLSLLESRWHGYPLYVIQCPGHAAEVEEVVVTLVLYMLQVNSTLQVLSFEAPPGTFAPEDVAQLQKAMHESWHRRRLHLLAGTHHRLGVDSPLSRLPHEVLSQIISKALPKRPCELKLELPAGLLLDVGSSDDDSEDDSDADTADSSDDDEQ